MPRLDFYVDLKPYLSVHVGETPVLIGRGDDCDVQLPGSQVSRHHVRIQPCDGDHEIEDLSRNGTRVNAALVDGRQRLEPGDRVYVADRAFIFQLDDAPIARLERSLPDLTVTED